MARSYKKQLGYCDRNPWNKNQANRRVRRKLDIQDGGAYRKLFCSYNICDYRFLYFGPEHHIKAEIATWYWAHRKSVDEIFSRMKFK